MAANVKVIRTERRTIVAKFLYGNDGRIWNEETEEWEVIPYEGEVRVNLSAKKKTISFRFPRERVTIKLDVDDIRGLMHALQDVIKEYAKQNS